MWAPSMLFLPTSLGEEFEVEVNLSEEEEPDLPEDEDESNLLVICTRPLRQIQKQDGTEDWVWKH